MAIELTSATPDFLSLPFDISPPFFFALWCRPETAADSQIPVWLGDNATNLNDYSLFVPHDNGNIWASSRLGGASLSAVTPNGVFIADEWVHVVYIADAGGGLALYVNGILHKMTQLPSSGSASGMDEIVIGRRSSASINLPFGERITRVALWSGLPTQFVVDALNSGKWPGSIRPADLLFFVPMVGNDSSWVDLVTDVAMTVTGSVVSEDDKTGLETVDLGELIEPAKPSPVMVAVVTNEVSGDTVTRAVTVVEGEDLIVVVHGRGGTAPDISSLSSDLDGAFIVDVEVVHTVFGAHISTSIGRLMSPTAGAHVITGVLTGSPGLTAIAVYRVTGIDPDNPLVDTGSKDTIVGGSGDKIEAFCFSGPDTLGIVGSSCNLSTLDPIVSGDSIGTERYDVDWTAEDGEFWGATADAGNRITPRMGLEHAETTTRAYAVAMAIYSGVSEGTPRGGVLLDLLG